MADLIEYNGKQLSLNAIASSEEIPKTSLHRQYKKFGDIYKAVEYCKNNFKEDLITKIEYHGEQLALKTIAKREGINKDLLKELYLEIKDIYKAVEIMKERQQRYHERRRLFDYNGEMLLLQVIAKKENLAPSSLSNAYERTGDLQKALELCKENQKKRKESINHIEYDDETLSIHAIAKKAGIYASTLSKVYKKVGNIYKAVLICQSLKAENERKKQRVNTTKYGEISYYDLSVVLGIKYTELKYYLSQGYTPDQIANMNLKPTIQRNISNRVSLNLPNGKSLHEYCIENGLNYACIYRAINIYGKSLTDAVDYYKHHGQQVPTTWIYEKYGVLLRHLLLRDHVDIDSVVGYMRKEVISLEDAVKKFIIKKNSKIDGLYDEWMEELYDVLTDESIKDEYDDYLKTFYVDEKEEECIKKCYAEVEQFKRKQLLYEISEALQEGLFSPEEEPELLKMYDITPEEIEIIFMDLYDRFEDPGVLMGELMQRQKTPEQIKEINDKIAKYKQMIQDNDILDVMRTAVGQEVAHNSEMRTELNVKCSEQSKKTQGTPDDSNDTQNK